MGTGFGAEWRRMLHSSGTVTSRVKRQEVTVHLDWRGGQLWGVDATTVTLRVHLGTGVTRVVDRSLCTAGVTVIIGDPVVCRVSGEQCDIVEVRPSRFAGSSGPRDQAASVARGEWYPGIVTEAEGWSSV